MKEKNVLISDRQLRIGRPPSEDQQRYLHRVVELCLYKGIESTPIEFPERKKMDV